MLDRADCAPEWHSLWQQTGAVLETTARRPFGGAQGKRQNHSLAALLSDEAVRRVGVQMVAAARREGSNQSSVSSATSSSSSSASSLDDADTGVARLPKRGKTVRDSDEQHDRGGDEDGDDGDVPMDDHGGRPDDLLCTDSLSELSHFHRGAEVAAGAHTTTQRAVLRELGAFAKHTLQSARSGINSSTSSASALEDGAASAAVVAASPSASILGTA